MDKEGEDNYGGDFHVEQALEYLGRALVGKF
jgi:hypothetical protein